MRNFMIPIGRALCDTVTTLVTGCGTLSPAFRPEATLAPAWAAWEHGDFAAASALATDLIARQESAGAGHFILALVAHVRGDYAGAIAHYAKIDASYRRRGRLEEPILWSYVHLGDYQGAQGFAMAHAIGKCRATAKRLGLAVARPLTVTIDSAVELAFTDDAMTPILPGIPARLNGRSAVVRLDTGGSFIHLSAEQAADFGITTVACEKDFAALSWGKVCYGVADLELKTARLTNVPVAVHETLQGARQMAEHLGVELGPLIGTNVLQQFLTTIDGPGKKLILSRRGDPVARADHMRRLPGVVAEIPFVMWSDHLMLARSSVGSQTSINLFVDSGLAVFTQEQGQAAVLAPQRILASWGTIPPAPGRLAELPGPLALGGASQDGMTAFGVPDKTWKGFGDWGGIRVDGLISWGFLKHFCWTLDFDRRVYIFGRA